MNDEYYSEKCALCGQEGLIFGYAGDMWVLYEPAGDAYAPHRCRAVDNPETAA